MKSASDENSIHSRFRILDGVVIQLSNAKGMIMLVVMFSEFGDDNIDLLDDVLTLSFALASLNFSAHLLWVSMGASIKNIIVKHPASQKILNNLFGTMMIAVAVWLLVRF